MGFNDKPMVKEWEINICGMFTGRDFDGFIREEFTPERILCSGNRTIVFWQDKSKTVIKLSDGDTPDVYNAFAYALAEKIFGSNNSVKKVVRNKLHTQLSKRRK